MENGVSRRALLAGTGALAAAALGGAVQAAPKRRGGGFRYSLNTSTVRGHKLPLVEEIDMASKAGYDAIEPWISEIDAYVKGGGSLRDLRKRLEDRNLAVESAIGFFDWIVDDPARRARGLEEARRNF